MRAFIAVLDSFGVGATADAEKFGDAGADTFGSIASACTNGQCEVPGTRSGALQLPNLMRLGLGALHQGSTGRRVAPSPSRIDSAYAWAAERSFGKDTPSGHWEMMGLPVEYDWGYFPKTTPCFPQALTDALIARANLPGLLGNLHSSGTVILEQLGEAHIATGQPIVYTSADSVFQIAAHEEHFGLERLYEVCRLARELVDEYQVGRVIARPFVGERAGKFVRTGNRKDLATPPHQATLLNHLNKAGHAVIGIGKIGDIFAYSGISQNLKAVGNEAVFDTLLTQVDEAPDGTLVFANFVDFDMLYGHRRDTTGYACALEAFDRRLPELERALRPDDVVVLTADHGCDPTFAGTDHTREHVPVIFFGPNVVPGSRGQRDSFADIGQSLAQHFGLPPLSAGKALDLRPAAA